jgi:hypothetical protein
VLYGRKRHSNPELLSVYNPPLSGGARMYVRRTNHPITVLYKGKLYTWQELVKKFGLKKAIKIWKQSKIKHHGRGKVKIVRKHVKHRRKHKKAKRKVSKKSRKSRKSRKGRKGGKSRKSRKGRKGGKSRKSRKGRKGGKK